MKYYLLFILISNAVLAVASHAPEDNDPLVEFAEGQPRRTASEDPEDSNNTDRVGSFVDFEKKVIISCAESSTQDAERLPEIIKYCTKTTDWLNTHFYSYVAQKKAEEIAMNSKGKKIQDTITESINNENADMQRMAYESQIDVAEGRKAASRRMGYNTKAFAANIVQLYFRWPPEDTSMNRRKLEKLAMAYGMESFQHIEEANQHKSQAKYLKARKQQYLATLNREEEDSSLVNCYEEPDHPTCQREEKKVDRTSPFGQITEVPSGLNFDNDDDSSLTNRRAHTTPSASSGVGAAETQSSDGKFAEMSSGSRGGGGGMPMGMGMDGAGGRASALSPAAMSGWGNDGFADPNQQKEGQEEVSVGDFVAEYSKKKKRRGGQRVVAAAAKKEKKDESKNPFADLFAEDKGKEKSKGGIRFLASEDEQDMDLALFARISAAYSEKWSQEELKDVRFYE